MSQGHLVLTRRIGQSILIGDEIEVTLEAVRGPNSVRISVRAPRQLQVLRREVLERDNNQPLTQRA